MQALWPFSAKYQYHEIITCTTGNMWMKSSPWIWCGSKRCGHFIFGNTDTIFSVKALLQKQKDRCIYATIFFCKLQIIFANTVVQRIPLMTYTIYNGKHSFTKQLLQALFRSPVCEKVINPVIKLLHWKFI